MNKKLEIDHRTADRIAVLSLKAHKKYLKKELDQRDKGQHVHPDDVIANHRLIDAIQLTIEYYEG